MILDLEYATDPKWLKLQTYISSDIPILVNNDIVMQALQYYGQASKDTITQFLSANSGPLLKIQKDGDPIDPNGDTPSLFYIQEQDVIDYENDAEIIITNYGLKVHKLGVSLLEIIVAANNGWNYDLVHAFAKNLYGIDDAHPWRQRQPDGSLKPYDGYV
jgi:hypothetical protein